MYNVCVLFSFFPPQIPSSCTDVYFLLVFQVFDVDLANLMSKKVNNNQVKMKHLQEDYNEQ